MGSQKANTRASASFCKPEMSTTAAVFRLELHLQHSSHAGAGRRLQQLTSWLVMPDRRMSGSAEGVCVCVCNHVTHSMTALQGSDL